MIILAATPIGNLGDASPRLREALEAAEIVAAEDTRTAQRLFAALGILNRPQLTALHDHNEKRRAAELAALAVDRDVLLLSDAGMPTVSDPGFGVVTAAIGAGVTVTAIPGPSAVLTALAVSGLATDRFTFEGFAPRKAGDRSSAFATLTHEPRTMVFFESPARTADCLAAMAHAFGADRGVAVCRELTKRHEEVFRGTLEEAQRWASAGVRGEVCIVVAGAEQVAVPFPAAVIQVAALVAQGTRLKDAAGEVSAATGHSSRDLYQGVLAARD